MAQEEPVAASTTVEASTLESPSPKRRNRKKGKRADDGDEQEVGDVANADLISLPSPVAATSTVDVFATLEPTMEQAMGELTLTHPTQKEDGLLKLPVFPSSGRIPRTPPPTPEPFLMHSPEKEQSRVAPVSPAIQLQPVVEVPTRGEGIIQMQVEVGTAETTPVHLATVGTVDVATVDVVEQETSTLSDTLADMSLSNGSVQTNVRVEKPAVTELIDNADDNVEFLHTANVEVNSISTIPIEDTTVPSAETAVPIALPTVEATLTETQMVAEPTPTATIPESTETSKTTALASAENLAIAEPTPTETPKLATSMQIEESKTLPESSSSPRRNKRKGNSPEHEPHTTSIATSRLFPVSHPGKAVLSAITDESAGKSTQATSNVPSTESQPRPAKRKEGESEIKPPPAPATVATKEIRPRRLVARPTSGSTLNKAKPAPEPKSKPEVVARPVHDVKKDSMMNPNASSVARATAAKARKALLKSATTKKGPVRKPLTTRATAKPQGLTTNLLSESVSAPPAPVAADDGVDSQRNVKRRLNATDAAAASNRLYEDAKEAKARRDARRAELQETYTFAPQVNNFKRRTVPGESEDPNQDRFSRLHAKAKELQEKKRELQLQHERDGCTFAPTISARAKRLAQPSSGPRYENLYKHAQELKQKREEKFLERAKTTEEQCPFKPKITTGRAPVKTKPLYDFEREKQKRLNREQKKIETEMSLCTFKPKVSTKRLKSKTEGPSDSTTETATDANPYNRLYQASIDRTERLQKLRQERDEEEKAQAPFQPKITNRSRVLKAKSKTKEPFHKRLYNKDYMKKLDAEREQRRLEGEQQFTFKPELNEPPEEIKAKVNERASPEKNIFERLYDEKDKMKEKIELGEELRMQKEMAECTFRPHIEVDTTQSNGESAPPVWERLLNYDKAQVIEEREKLKEQLEMQECTFKPEVKSPDALLTKRSPSSNVFDRLTGSGNSPLDPTRPSFITTRPTRSPGRQSPDAKIASIGRIIKLTKLSLPVERKKMSRTHSISQPSSVSKPEMKRSTSFSGSSSPTEDVLTNLVGGSRQTDATTTPSGDATMSQSVTDNYESWSAELNAKLRHL